ncbi:MAG: HAD-IIB family hydrolase [Faecalibacillus sp.]
MVVASARGELPDSLKDIPFDGFIGCDGGYIVFHDDVLLDNIFTVEQLNLQNSVYEATHGQYIISEHHNSFFSDKNGDLIKKHLRLYRGNDDIGEDYDDNWRFQTVKANTVTALFHNVKELYEAKNMLPHNWAINAYDTGHIRMDVHPPGFSKGQACQYLYQKLGIKKEDTYAFGDGDNDIEMLELVGTGIAMGNANDHVKEHADQVTLSVDEDGISYAFSILL